ncbi:MAG: bifunctional DNA-formamidopyrimidine glycosylase/DNA-(apurinic or apyrimidinic site) lyase [Candidatus Electrothrix sp. YB6]
MPELPEVEVTRQGLLPHVSGRTITAVSCSGKPLRQSVPEELLQACLCGKSISTVDRRAKYLLIRLQDSGTLVIHLGMTGRLGVFPGAAAQAKHDHLILFLDNGMEIRQNDTRRFGSIALWPSEQAKELEQEFVSRQGIEPFSREFTGSALLQLAGKSRQPVKNFLMDAHRISGIGNIYANEILFAAGLHPQTPANTLSEQQWQQVVDTAVRILTKAIEAGGSTISDFLGASGESGYFQLQLAVYGKEGTPCPRCGLALEKSVIAGRATFFCSCCQPL